MRSRRVRAFATLLAAPFRHQLDEMSPPRRRTDPHDAPSVLVVRDAPVTGDPLWTALDELQMRRFLQDDR